MTSLAAATERLERAIAQLERAAGQMQLSLGGTDPAGQTVLTQTAAHVAARLDAAIGRLDRLLEE